MGAQLNNKLNEFIKTGIKGFDELFNNGIPQGSSVLIAGGTGSGNGCGKTPGPGLPDPGNLRRRGSGHLSLLPGFHGSL